MSDPRVLFAAERTLLAWIRTGLTVIGLGFVVSRFGLFLRIMAVSATGGGDHPGSSRSSTWLGVLLVIVGAASIIVAVTQFQAFVRQLSEDELPHSYRTSAVVLLAYAIAAIGLILAIYLAR